MYIMIAERIKKPIYLSHILIAINIVVFAIMWLIDPKISTQTLANFGAKVNFLLVDGQWYRLITPMFLHVDFFHLLFNCMALAAFGTETELIFGKKKFLVIYFVSGLAGSIGSFIFSNGVSAGASGAIFGLIGANIYLYTLNREVYKKVFGNSVLVLLVINLIYGITNPLIDDSAHIAGLIGGFMITWSIGYLNQVQFTWKNYVSRILLVILMAGGLTVGYYKNLESEDYFLYKGSFQLNDGEIQNAQLTFEKASKKFPDNADFKSVLQQIENYKNTVK
jgi:rhomboid protease GluP